MTDHRRVGGKEVDRRSHRKRPDYQLTIFWIAIGDVIDEVNRKISRHKKICLYVVAFL